MGQFRRVARASINEESWNPQTTEWHQKDLLLFLLLNWSIEKISHTRMQEIWGFFLHALKKKGIVVEGFYKDVVTGRYRALENVIGLLFQFGLLESRSLSPGYFFFCSTPRVQQILREAAPDKLVQAIDEVGPTALRLYRQEISQREGLKILRTQRENRSSSIPA